MPVVDRAVTVDNDGARVCVQRQQLPQVLTGAAVD